MLCPLHTAPHLSGCMLWWIPMRSQGRARSMERAGQLLPFLEGGLSCMPMYVRQRANCRVY